MQDINTIVLCNHHDCKYCIEGACGMRSLRTKKDTFIFVPQINRWFSFRILIDGFRSAYQYTAENVRYTYMMI